MLKSVFRLIARLAFVAAAVYLARMALQRWVDGPEPEPASPGDRWAPVADAPRSTPPANPTAPTPPAAQTPPATETAPPVTESAPARPDRPHEADRSTPASGPAGQATAKATAKATANPSPPVADKPEKPGDRAGDWVAPDSSGAAPSTHPVKVKLSSRIYREPGASGYDRTRPDRCYTSAEAAEADGFVRAKR